MKKLKMFMVLGMMTVTTVSMTACGGGGSSQSPDTGGVVRYAVTMQDDSKVDCLYMSGVKEAAIECIWGAPSVETNTTDELESVVAEGNIPCVIHNGVNESAMSCDL